VITEGMLKDAAGSKTLRGALHEASIKVVGEARSARQVYPLVEAEKPDLLVAGLV
jgi:hypothetical protein